MKTFSTPRWARFAGWLFAGWAALHFTFTAQGQHEQKTETSFSFAGWSNRWPAVYAVSNQVSTNFMVVRRPQPPSNASPAVLAAIARQPAVSTRPLSTSRATNAHFHHYEPASLNHLLWTNFLMFTNRQTAMFTTVDRRARPPVFVWNTNSWVWGRRGLTACSPMSEAETWKGCGPGQIPITALTRRHGYTTGHALGSEASQSLVGVQVWFVTADHTVVARKIIGQQTRLRETSGEDYTVVLFDADLPAGVTPARVAVTNYLARYPALPGAPHPMAILEQGKTVQAGVWPFAGETWKGGDSGSPVFLPLPEELVFVGGTASSPPGPRLQADMDVLSRRAGLAPAAYAMQFVDLSRWPVTGGQP